MAPNKSIVWKIFNVEATDAKKVICNLYSNEFSSDESVFSFDEKVFSFDFNMKGYLFDKKMCSR